jgi:hypothetical protein
MELDTPSEKLAALETVFAIAFPPDEDRAYVPPELPSDGSKLSKEDKARRLAYNIFNGLIRYQGKKGDIRTKDKRKVEAGRLGAYTRWGDSSASTVDDFSRERFQQTRDDAEVSNEAEIEKKEIIKFAKDSPPQAIAGDDFSSVYEAGAYKYKKELTKAEEEAIAEWDRKIPNAQALHGFIEKNFLYATRPTAIKPDFCEFAYNKLAKIDRWISSRSNRPFKDIRAAIHYIALDYKKQLGEAERAEKEERRKNMEAEFQMKNSELSQMSATDLADLERRRRRQAEKEAAAKIMKGEL